MITRIVRLSIAPEHVQDFLQLFELTYPAIRHFDGCRQLRLYRDEREHHVFITYSEWDSSEHLNRYRASDLFQTTWKAVKALFCAAPVAFSMEALVPEGGR